jgi:hypothetical protein
MCLSLVVIEAVDVAHDQLTGPAHQRSCLHIPLVLIRDVRLGFREVSSQGPHGLVPIFVGAGSQVLSACTLQPRHFHTS